MGVIDDNFENEVFEDTMCGRTKDEHAKIKDKNADIKAYDKKIEEMKEKLAFSTNWDNSNTNSTIGVVEEPFPCDIAPAQELASTKGQALDDLRKIRFYADELIKVYESTNKE